MARSISSLAGYGMDYVGDLIEHNEKGLVFSPLRPSKKLNASGQVKGEDVVAEEIKAAANNEPGSSPEGKDNGHNFYALSEAMKKKIADERSAKLKKIEACIAKLKPAPKQCKYCDRAPCIMDEHYDDLMTMGSKMEDEDFDNKQIRFAMYRDISYKMWGPLGKGVRKQLPKCVVAEVHDAYPTKRGEQYVGFRPYESYKNVEVMSDSDVE
jgi:hypothetical protein